MVEPVVKKEEGADLDFLTTYKEEESEKLNEIVSALSVKFKSAN